MQNKESIKKIYIDKIKKLNKHNELYYLKNKTVIADKEYDELKRNILDNPDCINISFPEFNQILGQIYL